MSAAKRYAEMPKGSINSSLKISLILGVLIDSDMFLFPVDYNANNYLHFCALILTRKKEFTCFLCTQKRCKANCVFYVFPVRAKNLAFLQKLSSVGMRTCVIIKTTEKLISCGTRVGVAVFVISYFRLNERRDICRAISSFIGDKRFMPIVCCINCIDNFRWHYCMAFRLGFPPGSRGIASEIRLSLNAKEKIEIKLHNRKRKKAGFSLRESSLLVSLVQTSSLAASYEVDS